MNRLIIGVLIVLVSSTLARPSALSVRASAEVKEHPLILSREQGEARVWRPQVSESATEQKLNTLSRFVIKIDKQHGGSQDFWFGTETLPSGAGIPYHRHLHEDEVLYIVSGSAQVHVGPLVGDARPGTLVFIPRSTWVSVKSTGEAPISLLFAFNAPGFDRYMKCESVPLGQSAQLVTVEEDQRCTKMGDVQYR